MKKIFTFWTVLFLLGISTFGQIPTNGLVGWWAFNGNANDLSGSGNNGNIIGTQTFMTDRFGQQNAAIDLELSNVQVPDAASLDLSSDYTITLWSQVGLILWANVYTILNKGNSYVIQHYNEADLMGNPINNRYRGFTNLNSGIVCGIDQFHDLPTLPTWEFVAYKIQWNSQYNRFDQWLYINSQFVTSNYCYNPPQTNSNDLIFGSLWGRPLDDIRIYNRALSNDEILAIYNETPPNITIVSPNGYESWVQGTTQSITWTSSGSNNVKIEYTIDNGITWNLIVDNYPTNNGSYNWLVPNTPSNLCRVRATDVINMNVTDESNHVFSITAANISIQTPNGGEIWMAGTIQTISWSSTGVSYVNIEYSIDHGGSCIPVAYTIPASNGYYSWTVPNTPSGNCYIKISDVSNLGFFDFSDGTFTITPAVGIEEHREQVRVFPNPTTGQIRIQSDKIIQNVCIYNSMGIEVSTLSSETNEFTFNLSNFSRGVYYISVNIGDMTQVHKVVVL